MLTSSTAPELRTGRTARVVGVTAACTAVAMTGLAAFPGLRGAQTPPILSVLSVWPWFIAYACATILWFRGNGRGVRFSLHNPKPDAARRPRINVRFEGDRLVQGDGWIEWDDAGVRAVGWVSHRATNWLAAVLVIASVVSTIVWRQGHLTWFDFLLPAGAAWQLCRLPSIVDVPRNDLDGAAFLRGSVLLSRRSAAPLIFAIRESRAIELASQLRRLGCEVTSPASAHGNLSPPAADLDVTLRRLRETNDRLVGPPVR